MYEGRQQLPIRPEVYKIFVNVLLDYFA
jgi:hypothetical protein